MRRTIQQTFAGLALTALCGGPCALADDFISSAADPEPVRMQWPLEAKRTPPSPGANVEPARFTISTAEPPAPIPAPTASAIPISDAAPIAPPTKARGEIQRSQASATPSVPGPTTALLSLALVLGLFMLVAWFVRRGLPTGARTLPSEVVEVLGRAALFGRQQVQLVRFGEKLLLVALSPGTASTIAEISDPAEIDRIVGLCHGQRGAARLKVLDPPSLEVADA